MLDVNFVEGSKTLMPYKVISIHGFKEDVLEILSELSVDYLPPRSHSY